MAADVQTFVRGAEVLLSVEFTDAYNSRISPAAVEARITYFDDETRRKVTADLAMAVEDGVASVVWDSSPAAPGRVYWSVRTSDGGARRVAVDAQFELTANPANG